MEEIDYSQIGTGIMEEMLLFQYADSPLLKKYIKAYVEEINLLYVASNDVYLQRLLANAEGLQLDIIGRILGQSRNIAIAVGGYFAYQGVLEAKGFGERKFSEEVGDYVVVGGGSFRGGEDQGYTIVPLNDVKYRRLLYARAYSLSNLDKSINTIYKTVNLILGREVNMRMVEEGQAATLYLDEGLVHQEEMDLINAVKGWFTPMGVGLLVEFRTLT